MPGMDMGQQTHTDLTKAQADAHAGMVLLHGVSCAHQKCSQSSVSVSAVGADHGQFKTGHAVVVSVMPPRLNLLRPFHINTGASPSKRAAISPISTHLRI
jgi:hypothetical protein